MKKANILLILFQVTFCPMILSAASPAKPFKLGLENVSQAVIADLKTKRVGLITNQTGQDQKGRSTAQVLLSYGIKIKTIFAPEHGFTGKTAAELEVHDTVDPLTNIPIISLYGKASGKKIPASQVQDLDTLIFDMQDSGMRHYTYISTLFHALQSAAEHKKQMVVLDRPNPLGWHMEGPLVERELASFISIAPIPLRHGMTIGELAQYFNVNSIERPTQLTVIPMANYQREKALFCPTNQVLSPNIANKESCYGYSFLGLLGEVKPMDVAVGTDKAFQCILLPDHMQFAQEKWIQLQALLQQHHIKSKPYSYIHPQKKQRFVGLHLNFDHIHTVPSFKVLLAVLTFFKNEGIILNHSQFFDKAVGTQHVQKTLNGMSSFTTLTQTVNQELQQFFAAAQKSNSFLYHPYPHIVEL